MFDRSEVIEAAEREGHRREPGIAERYEMVAGDFFESVPEADAYIMKYVLHDWDDDRCVRILSNCRRALRGREEYSSSTRLSLLVTMRIGVSCLMSICWW